MNAKRAIGAAGQIGFMIACAGLIALWLLRTTGTGQRLIASAREGVIAPGTPVGQIDGVRFDTAALTIALVLHTDCQFCLDSIPFYQKLSATRRPGRVQIVALSHESIDTFSLYLKRRGIVVDAVAHIAGPELPSDGTPTLAIINAAGRVRRTWLGRLSADQEKEVMSVVSTTSTRNGG